MHFNIVEIIVFATQSEIQFFVCEIISLAAYLAREQTITSRKTFTFVSYCKMYLILFSSDILTQKHLLNFLICFYKNFKILMINQKSNIFNMLVTFLGFSSVEKKRRQREVMSLCYKNKWVFGFSPSLNSATRIWFITGFRATIKIILATN